MAEAVRSGVRLGKAVLYMLLVFFFIVLAVFFNAKSGLNYHLHQFSFHVRNQDKVAAQREMQALEYYRTQFNKWHLNYFSRNQLGSNMLKYEAALALLNEDFEKILGDARLDSLPDDYMVFHVVAIAKARILQAEYQATKDKDARIEIIALVVGQVRPDFEKAVRAGPGFREFFDGSHNYDITSDEENAKKMLESPKPTLKYVLGRNGLDGQPRPGEEGRDSENPLEIPSEQNDAGHSPFFRKRG